MTLTFQFPQGRQARGVLEPSLGIAKTELSAKQDRQLVASRSWSRAKPPLHLREPCRLGKSLLDRRVSPAHARGIPRRAGEVQKNLWGMGWASVSLLRMQFGQAASAFSSTNCGSATCIHQRP